MDRKVAPRRHQRVPSDGLFDIRRCHRGAGLFQKVLALGVCVWIAVCFMAGINDIVAEQGCIFCHGS